MKTLRALLLGTAIFAVFNLAAAEEAGNSYQKQVFRLEVDYYRSLKDGIDDGKYNWVHPDINVEHFPVKRLGKEKIDVMLIYFGDIVETDKIFREFEKMNLRPAEIRELIVLAEKYPDLQREFTIIAFGSAWRQSAKKNCYPALYGDRFSRELYLVCLGDDYWWSGAYWFAGVP